MSPELPDRLRSALEERAARVPIAPDALEVIRARVRSDDRRRRWSIATVSMATVAACVLAAAYLLSTPDTVVPPPPPAASQSTPAPLPAAGDRVPVYVVGTVAGRPVLYREYHAVSLAPGAGVDQQLTAALVDMISGRTLDPDYHGAWPTGVTVTSVTSAGDTITVELAPGSLAPANPALALQQLVHTATAVAADAGAPALVRVRIAVAGQSTLWGVPLGTPLVRSSSVDTLAPVWLSSPQEGDTVHGKVTVQIVGTVPGGVADLLVTNASGAIVLQRAVHLDKDAPERGSATLTLDLAPGRYRLTAYYIDDDGRPAAADDHAITVS